MRLSRPLIPARSLRRPGAFTLIELLIVIGIIAILIAIVMAVGSRVANSGRYKLTKDSLNVLEHSLTAYISETGAPPPALALDPRPKASPGDPDPMQPVADALNNNADPTARLPINSVGLYISQCQNYAVVMDRFKGVDAKILRMWDADGPDTGGPDYTKQAEMLTMFDGWGNPIRYVHPKFHGWIFGPDFKAPSDRTQAVLVRDFLGPAEPGRVYGVASFRRNPGGVPGEKGDADGGMCLNGRPYFYSAGPDGDPSTLGDNIYSSSPEYQKN